MDRPIGMFDSGFGGHTVARAGIDLLPHEHLVYIGDTGRYPYGPRPQAEVREFAHQLAWSLVKDHDVKAIVVACNTASAAALDELEAELPVPVIDVVAPGARALVKASRSGKVGVIGTVGTIRSGAYERAVAATGAHVQLTSAACPGLVEFVERGQTSGDEQFQSFGRFGPEPGLAGRTIGGRSPQGCPSNGVQPDGRGQWGKDRRPQARRGFSGDDHHLPRPGPADRNRDLSVGR